MYPNQKINGAFGDIYSIGSPYLDKLSDRLYQEDRQKKQQEAQSAKMLDDEFAKNMAGIRDADIPDLTKAYGDWKLANMQLLKNKNATPEQQMEVLRKKASMYDTLSKSKTQKDLEKAQGVDVIKNPNHYVRDAHGQLINIMKVPVSKMNEDLLGKLRYQGNATNFAPLLKGAVGTPKNMEDEVVTNPNGLQKEVTRVKRVNNAPEYFDAIRSGIVGSQGSDDFLRTFGNVTPEAYKLAEDQYNQMMADPVMAKRFGNPKPLPPTEDLTDVEKAAKYMAMQHAIVNHPVTEVGKVLTDAGAMLKAKEDIALRKLRISEAGKNARVKAMLNGVEVPDVLAKAEKNAVPFYIELPIVGEINKVLPDGSKIESVIPLSKVDALELEDILGKKDKYNQTPIRTYRNNNTGKEFILKGQDGKFYGEGMQEISPDRVLNSTYNRTKGELKATYKKEITKPTGQPKNKTISSGTIKSLIGKKGYEGYTEKELIDYYKSNGYDVN